MKWFWKLVGFVYRQKKLENKNLEDIDSILVVNTQGIGDFMMLTPLLNELTKYYRVDILTNSTLSKKLVKLPIRKFYFFTSIAKTFFTLRKNHYDLVYFANGGGPKSALFSKFLKYNYFVSHEYILGGYKTSFNADISIPQSQIHRVEENMKLLPYLEKKLPEKITYYINENYIDENFVKSFLDKYEINSFYGIHPGGDKNNPEKRFPVEKYADYINKEKKVALIFLGPDEKDLKKSFTKFCDKNKIVFIENSLPKTLALVKQCRYLIHSDSSFGHFAAALGVKTVTIVGPTNWIKTKPYSSKDVILKHPKQASPMERNMEDGFILREGEFLFPEKIEF